MADEAGYLPGGMSTSPVRHHARVGAIVLGLALVFGSVACSDDDEVTTPTTTNPERSTTASTGGDDGGSTTTAPDSSTTSVPPTTGTRPATITPTTVRRDVQALMARFQVAVRSAKSSGAFDESYQRAMSLVFTAEAAQSQTTSLEQFGGIAVLRQPPGLPRVGAVRLVKASADCVAATVDVSLDPFVTKPIPVPQPATVRLVPAEEGSSTPWRLAFFSYGPDGEFLEEASC